MATRHLGELGTKRDPVDMAFDWFGTLIRVGPHAGDIPLIAFLEEAAKIDSGDEVGIMFATKAFLHGQIDEADWDTFLRIAHENNQQFEDLLQVAKNIVQAVTLFPTGRPSASSDGRPSTSPKLKAASSSPVAQAMQSLKGRPDLKMVIWQAQEAQRADAAPAA